MTGVITDLGIELGRLIYWNRSRRRNDIHFVKANRDKIFIHGTILGLFFLGGIVGALAFKSMGFSATIPIALLLVAVAVRRADCRQVRQDGSGIEGMAAQGGSGRF